MSEKDDDVMSRADCPANQAPKFPGKKTRNNPTGTLLTKSEFIEKEIEAWVNHFNNSNMYHETYFAHKIIYLRQHLKDLSVEKGEMKRILIQVEKKLAKETEEENLTHSQNLLGGEMDVDVDTVETVVEDHGDEKSRWDREKELEEVLNLSDRDVFDSELEIDEEIKQARKFKQREKSYFLSKSDEELFAVYDKIPSHIKRNEEFKERHRIYVENYMQEQFASSQDILEKLSQIPIAVQSSEIFKDRICHLSYQDRSEKLVMKNIKETVKELKKTPEGRKQCKIFMAGVSHPVFGDPGLNVNSRTRKEVIKIKENLLTGVESTLKAEEHKKRTVFPKGVEEIAINHWMENTIPEPAKHTGKAMEVEGETVPTRYQDKTDKEFYENFKEECKEKVKVEMTKASQDLMRKLAGRPDSTDKQRRLAYADQLTERFACSLSTQLHQAVCMQPANIYCNFVFRFPSLDWYVDQRPPQTKALCDHTTGLCHLCEAAKVNFTTLVRSLKRHCVCGTQLCPNWFCVCPEPDEEEDEDKPCSCNSCECELCMNCQVKNLFFSILS